MTISETMTEVGEVVGSITALAMTMRLAGTRRLMVAFRGIEITTEVDNDSRIPETPTVAPIGVKIMVVGIVEEEVEEEEEEEEEEVVMKDGVSKPIRITEMNVEMQTWMKGLTVGTRETGTVQTLTGNCSGMRGPEETIPRMTLGLNMIGRGVLTLLENLLLAAVVVVRVIASLLA
jgi:hypothetical protein